MKCATISAQATHCMFYFHLSMKSKWKLFVLENPQTCHLARSGKTFAYNSTRLSGTCVCAHAGVQL